MPARPSCFWDCLLQGADEIGLTLSHERDDILLSQGVAFGRVIEELTAVTTDPGFGGLLGTEVGLPLLRVTRLVYDRADRPLAHLTVHLSPLRSGILLNVPTDGAQTSVASRIVHDLAVP